MNNDDLPFAHTEIPFGRFNRKMFHEVRFSELYAFLQHLKRLESRYKTYNYFSGKKDAADPLDHMSYEEYVHALHTYLLTLTERSQKGILSS
jgi:hypothetical protein